MEMNKIHIVQNTAQSNTGEGRTEYHFYTPNNIYVGGVCLPYDGQYTFDAKVLNFITKALAIRWRLVKPPKNF